AGCMAEGEPAHTAYWEANGYLEEQPVTTVVFHLREGGDVLYTAEGSEWAQHQNIQFVPFILTDDGYRNTATNEATIEQDVNEAGARTGITGPPGIGEAFRKADVEVTQLFTGSSFRVKAAVRYNEKEGGVLALGELRGDGDTLNGFINICMVEDHVDAYSPEIDMNVTCHNVFRGFAAKMEPVVLQPGESWSGEFTWTVPELDPGDNQVPIDITNVFVVAVLYDSDDTSSGGANGWPGATRSINSATPLSTAYDHKATPPAAGNATAFIENEKTKITVPLESDNGIAGAFIAYNTNSSNHSGTWTVEEMNVSDTNEAVAYLDTMDTFYYRLMVYDDNWTEARTETMELRASNAPSKEDEGGSMLIPILAVLLVLGAAFYFFKDKIPMLAKKQETVAMVEEPEPDFIEADTTEPDTPEPVTDTTIDPADTGGTPEPT
ncbi:MAG: hypothetical protein KAT70_09870, partial [Thermoplasmata archaeon]|nr:hypothetical protein [Thermoplasmata archaeon]